MVKRVRFPYTAYQTLALTVKQRGGVGARVMEVNLRSWV